MRDRKEIEAGQNFIRHKLYPEDKDHIHRVDNIHQLQLEVLLDIRDLLTKPKSKGKSRKEWEKKIPIS